MSWTTRVLPELTRPYGVEEAHNAWFVPKGWPGKGPAVSLLIPECELQLCILDGKGEPVLMINRPSLNKNVKAWIRSACRVAIDYHATISFGCDTAEQAERAAKMAHKLLPNHERAAIERMYEARSRSRGTLQ